MSQTKEQLSSTFLEVLNNYGISGSLAQNITLALVSVVEPLLGSEQLASLEAILHEKQRHPHYDYDTKECDYSDEARPPEGFGWVVNPQKRWRKDDGRVTTWWMRLKTDKLKDDINVFELPEIKLNKVSKEDLVKLLRTHFNTSYMPSATGEVEFNSKPEYVRPSDIVNLSYGTNTYCVQDDYTFAEVNQADVYGIWPTEKDRVNNVIYAGIDLADQYGLEILVNLKDPREECWVRAQRADKTWQKWEKWSDYSKLSVNPAVLDELIQCL